MRKWTGRVAGLALIIVGLAAAIVNAYVLGLAEGKSQAGDVSEDSRLRSIKLTSATGTLGGGVIVLVGALFLSRSASEERPGR